MLSAELMDAFISLQKTFYTKPSAALHRWIEVDDYLGQIIISLLNGFVNRCADERCDLLVKDNKTYSLIHHMIELDPWNTFFEYVANSSSIKVRDSITREEILKLAESINGYHRVIE